MSLSYMYIDEDADAERAQLIDVAKTVGIRFSSCEEPFIVALDEDVVVGGAAVATYGAREWAFSVVVLPKYQRRGVGAEVIRRVVSSARLYDVDELSAVVVNEALRPLLRRLGFRPVLPDPRRVRLDLRGEERDDAQGEEG